MSGKLYDEVEDIRSGDKRVSPALTRTTPLSPNLDESVCANRIDQCPNYWARHSVQRNESREYREINGGLRRRMGSRGREGRENMAVKSNVGWGKVGRSNQMTTRFKSNDREGRIRSQGRRW